MTSFVRWAFISSPFTRGRLGVPNRSSVASIDVALRAALPFVATRALAGVVEMPESGPVAAYLYILSLDPPERAWEYLRRNPGYRCDWERQVAARTPTAQSLAARRAEPWGLRFHGEPDLRRPLGRAGLAA